MEERAQHPHQMNSELLCFDIYGCRVNDLDRVKDQLEAALGISMQERDSTYYDRYFSADSDRAEEIDCKRNWNFDEDEILFKEYGDYPILVDISGTIRPEEFENKLKASELKFELLDREWA